MAFGPTMYLEVPQKEGETPLKIELAALEKERMGEFVKNGGMQRYPVVRFLSRRSAPVLEDEMEWFEKTRTDDSSINWGIWVQNEKDRRLIGSTSLVSIEHGPTGLKQATSGVLIFDTDYWKKSIASHIHMARTRFAFTELGIARIKSAVIDGNTASLRALEKCGYVSVYVERNTSFTNGTLCHQRNLECINPLEPFWSTWWGQDNPSEAALAAKERSMAALTWAEKVVTFP